MSLKTLMDYHLNFPDTFNMERTQPTDPKKRTLSQMHAQELSWKLKSKADFIKYLDSHRRSRILF